MLSKIQAGILLIIIFLIGILNHIPIFYYLYYPSFLDNLYMNYSPLIKIGCFPLLYLVTIFSYKFWTSWATLVLYLLVYFYTPQLRDFNNSLVINYNKNRKVEHFRSPIVGYKIFHIKEGRTGAKSEVMFKFTSFFFVEESLIFSKNHGLGSKAMEGEEEGIYKVYNSDWYWYQYTSL